MRNSTTYWSELLQRQHAGQPLEQAFYTHSQWFEQDLRLLSSQWLMVGHVSQVPQAGDYFTYTFEQESIIIIRGNDEAIYAHYNVCRHRGSRICLEKKGHARRLTCPYHAWSYGFDGQLLGARGTMEEFDRSRYPLKSCRLEIWQGLIFINLADEKDQGRVADFAAMTTALNPFLRPHHLSAARVAQCSTHSAQGNWKLAVENFRECHHCIPAHPEYTKTNDYVRASDKDGLTGFQHGVMADKNDQQVSLNQAVIPESVQDSHSDPRQPYSGYSRFIKAGWLTGSENGQGVAPLMGELTAYDGRVAFLFLGPLNYLYVYNDHVVLIHMIPRSATQTDTVLTWLVRGDYQPDQRALDVITWLWQRTADQDAWLIENNQAGVNSRHYTPGPYVPAESKLVDFMAWYLQQCQTLISSKIPEVLSKLPSE